MEEGLSKLPLSIPPPPPPITASPECRAAQPQPAQVLRARGERQGRRVDRGRAGVSEAETTKDDRVCGPRPGWGAPTRGMGQDSPLPLQGTPVHQILPTSGQDPGEPGIWK